MLQFFYQDSPIEIDLTPVTALSKILQNKKLFI